MPKLERVIHGLSVVVAAVRRGLRFLFGKLSWEPPRWAASLGGGVRRGAGWVKINRARAVAVFGALVLLAGGGALLRRWYLHLPRPVLVKVTVTPPGLTPIEEKIRPRPLLVDFDASVAPLKQIGKGVTSGGALAPPVEGTGKWVSDQQLSFLPRADWAIGQD